MEPVKFDPEVALRMLLADEIFQTRVPEGRYRELNREMLDRLPVLLGDLMDQPVSLRTVLTAQLRILRDDYDPGRYLEFIRAAPRRPETASLDLNAPAILETLKYVVEMTIRAAEETLADIPGLLKEQGKSEEEALMQSHGSGLNAVGLTALRAGTLTIAEMYMTQPRIFADFRTDSP
ncbi:MAG: hypothetical protein WCO25_03215 [Candidatus Uhrbacteria bacterium]